MPRNLMTANRRRRKKQRDPKYLAWIRTLPCEIFPGDIFSPACGGRVEAHHAGDHGLAQKPPDRTAIPLCAKHHRTGKESAHVLGKNFWKHHNLDRDQIIRELNERYNQL